MPMSGPVLGALLDVAANVAQPATAAPSLPVWLLVGTAIVAHLQTAAIASPGSLTSPTVGGPVTGTGTVTGMSSSTLGGLLAAASGSLSPPATAATLPVWTSVAGAIISEITTNATIVSAFSAPPAGLPPPATAGGPLTGTGTIASLSASRLGPAMNNAAGTATSATALASWNAIATQIVAHIQTLALVPALGLVCPPGGGAITGASTLT